MSASVSVRVSELAGGLIGMLVRLGGCAGGVDVLGGLVVFQMDRWVSGWVFDV